MTTRQIYLVKQSWKKFRGINPATLGDLFYSKLFTDHPSLRKKFPADMQLQYQKLIDMLYTVINSLDRPAEIADEMTAMGQRHTGYAVRPAHYQSVGNALLWTLQRGLGPEWNEELKSAWSTCYYKLADIMISSMSKTGKSFSI